MCKVLKNQRGASLLYVLMALMFVAATAMLVLNMAKSDSTNISLHKSTELSRFSATSGLVFAANALRDLDQENDGRLLGRLNHFLASRLTGVQPHDTAVWFVGGPNSFEEENGLRFRARIVNVCFDRVTSVSNDSTLTFEDSPVIIMFESESIDRSGSRARNAGIYKVLGFEFITEKAPLQALYLGGGNMWIHNPVTVNGPAYIGNSDPASTRAAVHLSAGGANASQFNGEFRMFQAEGTLASQFTNTTFGGKAFFRGGRVWFTGSTPDHRTLFQRGFGGSAQFFAQSANVQVANGPSGQINRAVLGNGFLRQGTSFGLNFLGAGTHLHWATDNVIFSNANGSTGMGTDNTTLTTPLNFPNEGVSGEGARFPNAALSENEILDLLDMPRNDPPPLSVNLSPEILARVRSVTYNAVALTSNELNNLFNSAQTPKYRDKNGNDWMVLEVRGNTPFGPGAGMGTGGTFNHRAIIINRSGGGVTLPNVSNNGNILFYIPPDGPAQVDFTAATGSFRGMFFNGSSNTRLNISPWTPITINGAFYNVGDRNTPNNATIQLGAGGANRITINFEENSGRRAVQELIDLGVVSENETSESASQLSRIPNTPLVTELLARKF